MFKKQAMNFLAKILKNKYAMAGVPVIIKNSKGEILLGKREKDAPCYPNMWGLPGGIIEYNETIEQTAKRELKEEIGINVRIIKYGKPFNQLPKKQCPIHSINIPVYCKIQKNKPKPKQETSEVKWFKPKQIKKMNLAYSHKEILKQEGII